MEHVWTFLVLATFLAGVWALINVLKPFPKLGLKTRRRALGALVLAFVACFTFAYLGAKADLAALRVSDTNAYLSKIRNREGDAFYLSELKELDPARWKIEAPAIQAAIDAKQKAELQAKQQAEADKQKAEARERFEDFNKLEAALDAEFGTKKDFDELQDTSRGTLPTFFGMQTTEVQAQYTSPTGSLLSATVGVRKYGTSAQDIRHAMNTACGGTEDKWEKYGQGGTLDGTRCNAVYIDDNGQWTIIIEKPN